MAAYTVVAVCPIHNTGSAGGTRAIGVGEFVASPNVLSIHTVHRKSHWFLGKWPSVLSSNKKMCKYLLHSACLAPILMYSQQVCHMGPYCTLRITLYLMAFSLYMSTFPPQSKNSYCVAAPSGRVSTLVLQDKSEIFDSESFQGDKLECKR